MSKTKTTAKFSKVPPLRKWREDKCLYLSDLAKSTGLSEPMFSLVERGLRTFAPATQAHVAKCLRVSPEILFGKSPFAKAA